MCVTCVCVRVRVCMSVSVCVRVWACACERPQPSRSSTRPLRKMMSMPTRPQTSATSGSGKDRTTALIATHAHTRCECTGDIEPGLRRGTRWGRSERGRCAQARKGRPCGVGTVAERVEEGDGAHARSARIRHQNSVNVWWIRWFWRWHAHRWWRNTSYAHALKCICSQKRVGVWYTHVYITNRSKTPAVCTFVWMCV